MGHFPLTELEGTVPGMLIISIFFGWNWWMSWRVFTPRWFPKRELKTSGVFGDLPFEQKPKNLTRTPLSLLVSRTRISEGDVDGAFHFPCLEKGQLYSPKWHFFEREHAENANLITDWRSFLCVRRVAELRPQSPSCDAVVGRPGSVHSWCV